MAFGVDEAGKGPVLGSMFAAAVAGDPADLPDGVADSSASRPSAATNSTSESGRAARSASPRFRSRASTTRRRT